VYNSKILILSIFYKIREKSKLIRKILNIGEKLNLIKSLSQNQFKELLESNYDFKNLRKYKLCIIRSFSSFFQKHPYYQMFILNEEMKNRVIEETKLFSKLTIGVHIRRTDNLKSIENSPTYAFISRMEELINNNSEINFYVASDDMEVKKLIKNKFGDKIILPQGNLSRNTENGIRQAVVEMYSLSRTNKILGSCYSSFSRAAAQIGNIELEVVR
jgi:hypothetical protein